MLKWQFIPGSLEAAKNRYDGFRYARETMPPRPLWKICWRQERMAGAAFREKLRLGDIGRIWGAKVLRSSEIHTGG